MSRRLSAILEAVLVTFLWSTSWVLIKVGLRGDLPALTFAGVRYVLASIVLLPWVLGHPGSRSVLQRMPGGAWVRLGLFGIVVYTLTQGSLFLSLSYLPANPVSLVLNLTPLLVAGGSLAIGGERPTPLQGLGVLVAAGGVAAFFLPVGIVRLPAVGVAALAVCLGSNAVSSLMGRAINRRLDLPPLIVTFVGMAVGSAALLALGMGTQGLGTWKPEHWWIVAWLALVNTALTFTLWNHTLRTLTAVESSILNGLMLPQIVFLAYVFLGEILTGGQIAGLVLVGVGTLVVQIRRERGQLSPAPGSPSPPLVDG